jgi:ribonuclease III
MVEALAAQFGLETSAPHFGMALTHPSFGNEQDVEDNQRLEFLGDAVLGFCASEVLFARYPAEQEGTLTLMRARLVNAESLASWARANQVPAALRLGKGAEASGLRESTNVLADAVEALVAATFLDAGLDAARRACLSIIEPQLEALRGGPVRDPKSELQERIQAQGGETPRYEVVDSGGPAHERWFSVSVRVGSQELARGRGRSKRSAEFAAAATALADLTAKTAEE